MNSMIQTIDLTKKFGDFTANDHINLDVKEQEIKCIVGENGAGKSTMTVSYTHLDVYKRQEMERSVIVPAESVSRSRWISPP